MKTFIKKATVVSVLMVMPVFAMPAVASDLKTKAVIGWEMDDNDLVPIYGHDNGTVQVKDITNMEDGDPVYGTIKHNITTRLIVGWDSDGDDFDAVYQ